MIWHGTIQSLFTSYSFFFFSPVLTLSSLLLLHPLSSPHLSDLLFSSLLFSSLLFSSTSSAFQIMAKSLGALLKKQAASWTDDDPKKKNSATDAFKKIIVDKGEKENKVDKDVKEERDGRGDKVERVEREIKDEKIPPRGMDRVRDSIDTKVGV